MTMGPSGSTGGLSVGHWISNQATSSSTANIAGTTNVGTGGTGPLIYAIISGGVASVPNPPPVEDAGIRTGEITGYRAWILHDGLLHSVFWYYIWHPKVVGHAIVNDQGSGFYAFKTPEKAISEYQFYTMEADGVIFGEVLLWGKVIEHERGYRAEYASIKCLTYHSAFRIKNRFKFWKPSTLDKVRELYGV